MGANRYGLRPPPRLKALAAAVVLGLIGAACGSSHPSTTSGTTSSTQSGSSRIGGGFSLATVGGAGEGPYPWKYPGSGKVTVGSGTTISATSCTSGAPQFDSPYAVPCIAKFTGNNGGATYDGVTANQITIANRVFPETSNAAEVAAQAKADGAALPQVNDQVEQVFLAYFNKVFDLYGRKVVIVPVTSTSNSTAEALNTDQAQACADADKIANSVHAFGELGIGDNFTGGSSGPFAVCAAQDKLVNFEGGAYFDESFYQQYNPYVWDLPMDCERIAASSAEAYSKLLAGHKAVYAGDATLRSTTRKFGTYVPNLPAYTGCTNISVHDMESLYHQPASAVRTVFTYGLDISTFQQSAQQAVVQFKAAGVTTVITACDPFSLALLTKAAVAQNYHPEWLLNGASLDDEDSVAQSYDQAEVAGHLFGLSEAAPETATVGPDSPAGKLYQQLTHHQIPTNAEGNYSSLVWLFDALQAAGPDLTPQNMARGVHAIPPLGAPGYAYGGWNFNEGPSGRAGSGDHTAVNDARWIWWNSTGTSPDNGRPGTYVAVFGGHRYSVGQWPSPMPALFTSG